MFPKDSEEQAHSCLHHTAAFGNLFFFFLSGSQSNLSYRIWLRYTHKAVMQLCIELAATFPNEESPVHSCIQSFISRQLTVTFGYWFQGTTYTKKFKAKIFFWFETNMDEISAGWKCLKQKVFNIRYCYGKAWWMCGDFLTQAFVTNLHWWLSSVRFQVRRHQVPLLQLQP